MPNYASLHLKIFTMAFAFFCAVLLISVAWYYRDDLFQNIYDPGQPFQTYAPPPAPDYAQSDGWLVRPDPDIDSINTPGGDVFVIAPTIYLGGKHWNAPTKHPRNFRNFRQIVIPNYIMPYGLAGRLYAPEYRQASLYTFLTNREDAQAAQKFAYQDVKRAFEVFLSENPPERPIVLVGHGQGALHAQRLLSEYFSGDLGPKLAVAYIIDHPLLMQAFDDSFPNLHPCQKLEDTNCVVAFGAFTPRDSVRAQHFTGRNMVWNGNAMESVNGRELLCVNPLIWQQTEDYAPPRLHLGGVAAEGLEPGAVPAPLPKQTGAQCMDGILLIDKPQQMSLRRPSRFGGKFRTPPFNLFYEDLRVDAARRVQNLIDLDILPKRAPLMDFETIEIEESPVTLPQKPINQ